MDLTTFSNLFHRQNLNYTAPLGKTIKKFHWGFIQASPNREKLNALRHWVLSQGTRIGYGLKAQVQLSCLRTKSCLTESCGAPKSSPDLTRAKSRIEGNGNIQSPLSHELRRLNKFWAQIRVQRVKLRKNHYSIFNLSKKIFFRPLLIVKWPPPSVEQSWIFFWRLCLENKGASVTEAPVCEFSVFRHGDQFCAVGSAQIFDVFARFRQQIAN